MNIAIIPTAYRTIFFHAVACRLELNGHRVFWLSPNGRWACWLYRQGVPKERVLVVTSQDEMAARAAQPSADEISSLQKLEASASLTINNILVMDSLLGAVPRGRALKYLAIS